MVVYTVLWHECRGRPLCLPVVGMAQTVGRCLLRSSLGIGAERRRFYTYCY